MAARKKRTSAKKKSTALATSNVSTSISPLQNTDLLDRFKSKLPVISANHWISANGGRFSFGENDLGNEIEVVILNYCFENNLYTEDYDPDNITPPACFALNEIQEELKPHELVKDPCDSKCSTCENNQFGSADKGNGKACRNIIRLAVVHVDDIANPQARVLFVRISPSALTAMSEYLNGIANIHNAVPFQIVTKLYIEPLPKGFAIFPEEAGYTDSSCYENLEKLMVANQALLLSPPQVQVVDKSKKAKSKAKAAPRKKAASSKKAAPRKRKF